MNASTAPPRREIFTELQLEDGTILAKGDTIHCQGEPGASFVFHHLAVNPSGHQAVSCHGGVSGHGMWRAFQPEKVIVRKGRKAIRLAEYGNGDGIADPEVEEVAEVAEVAAAAKPDPDFEIVVRAEKRKATRGGAGALEAQVADERVRAGTEISHGEHRAIITVDGCFEIAGERFTSPSSAASHALGGRAANGWVWWRLPDGRKLEVLR